ncbi:AAC(3) family N-acetyltransferase [Streptomyces clavuligerus]|uniref:Aminoglycoside N3-acetyltransferase n=1 Tax=Streptomyces clavuligerus TaxID=1901 RepID=E2PXA5_STRCL|nr:AAC(3) family N-acetyltransferase [Streptomyces clavuligerus]AXU16705.1 aminoglycoside N(3)-acetyltransferase [Streptomyces clavuligerus]EFG06027.1 Aminoglycoside N3-acetyltransferase [Streptomyces clavuligerus]MBY6305643.1 AAC(3) family N-acetyltransferase [Streptomyces clavuligerus]QCS09468.1 aminoglycoside N(3)-acetyltransferase [Streptomyces clavuligerus]QPJ92351.1 aminoglycoside N(3)-acetyltransferase [Streptomyces clavuligerus]
MAEPDPPTAAVPPAPAVRPLPPDGSPGLLRAAPEPSVRTAPVDGIRPRGSTAARGGPGRAHLARSFRALGVRPGTTLLVHAGLRGTGVPPDTLRQALTDALGPGGTLVVPAFTAANSDTSDAYRALVAGLTPDGARAFRAAMPPFDAATTPSQGMGRLAESVRTAPGAVRSAHPQTSFAAVGHHAAELLAHHPLHSHLGENSPLGALYRAAAHVLMINVGFEVCTAFHLAEYRVNAPLRTYRCVVPTPDGGKKWTEYEDVRLDDSDFGAIGAAFTRGMARKGRLGNRSALLFPLRAAVDHAVEWMTEKRH